MHTAVSSIESLPNFDYRTFAKLDKWLRMPDEPSSTRKLEINSVFGRLTKIAQSKDYGYPFAKGTPRVAPVEFVFICEHDVVHHPNVT